MEHIQNTPVTFYSVRIDKRMVRTGIWGTIPVYLVQPELMHEIGQSMISETLTIAGDSAGGNLAIASALLTKFRKGPAGR